MHASREHVTVSLGRIDEMLRRGLEEILAQDPSIRLVERRTQEAAITGAGTQRTARVMILDELVEPATLYALWAIQPTIGMVVLVSPPATVGRERTLVVGAVRLFKDADAGDVLDAVHRAASETRHPSSLTAREAEVLECLSLGYSYAETAQALWISVETVRTHSARIRCKLGVRSKRDLIAGSSRSHTRTLRAGSRQARNGLSEALQKITL